MGIKGLHNKPLAAAPAWVRHKLNYGAIGAICVCASNLVVIACSFAGIECWNATVLSFVLVTPGGYILQSRFTFGVKLSARRFIRFSGSVALGAFLFAVLISLFCGMFKMPIWIASPLATVFVLCWNYVASRWAVI